MKLEHSFRVEAPIDRVWKALIDVQRVAPCLPGAEITDAGEDGVYHGNFTVKLGPTTAAYRGELHMESVDEAGRTVTMRASGQDKRGQGGAKATIVSVLSQDGEATKVDVDTDFTITGRLARFGRGGMIKDISNRLLGEFSDCLASTIEAEPPDPAADAPAEPAASPAEPAAAPPGEPVPPPPAPAPTPAKPVNGITLFLSVLRQRLARLFGRPGR
jgi:carbon monoxide dehydrogenase subunit G